ncbi:MAG: trypsin-like peptidase domain-containing protein [Bacteroidales bacterium]|nr:trypsin-like peptidase domain-containing protein [Bacteroidales bacterium]
MKAKIWLISFFTGLLGAFVAIMIFGTIYSPKRIENVSDKHNLVNEFYESRGNNNENIIQPVLFGNNESTGETNFTNAVELGLPTVVHVKTQYNQPNYTLYDFIFGTNPRYSTPVMSSGSGVIISSDGYIVTNNHVIDNAEIIEIVLNNKSSYPAKLVGRDATTDIALLKIEAENLSFIKYGNSDELRIGEWVIAIGNPFNLTSTATAGIVSAKARNINILSNNLAIESFIQTDAAVNPGNSGGALINTKGELVGINTAIASKNGSFVGYSFAIPVNIVRKVVADLVEFGEVQRAYLGLDMVDIDAQIAKKLNITNIEGVYVARVWDNGAADKAGIEIGDIIVAINSNQVNSNSELLENISRFRPSETISILIKRDNKPKKIKVKLQNKYGETGLTQSKSIDKLGGRFEQISNNDKIRLRINSGVQVTDIMPGKLAANGVQKGFIIVRINNTYINSVEDIEKLINDTDGVFLEGIYPNGTTAYYAFKL